jgi:thioredoxin 1
MEIAVNSENFKTEVLEAEGVVLVDFFATWCGPCMMMKPVIEQVLEESEGLKVALVDIDQASDLASENGVMSVPTFKIFKNGEMVDEWTGAISKAEVAERVKKAQ